MPNGTYGGVRGAAGQPLLDMSESDIGSEGKCRSLSYCAYLEIIIKSLWMIINVTEERGRNGDVSESRQQRIRKNYKG